jgi:hypothetical protein
MFLWIIIILIILYIYYIQFSDIKCDKIFLDDAKFKTGDMILFKGANNFNAIFIGNYFTHCGIVVIDNGIPMLFEANGIENMHLKEHHPKNGIFYTPLKERIQKYKGRVFLKALNTSVKNETNIKDLIDYCQKNFKYDTGVFSNSIKTYLGIKRCNENTNCGQLTFLSLISLGLIEIEEYDIPVLHHLKYVCNIKDLRDNKYEDLIEVVDYPFAH